MIKVCSGYSGNIAKDTSSTKDFKQSFYWQSTSRWDWEIDKRLSRILKQVMITWTQANGKGDYKQFDNMTEWNTKKRMAGNDWINIVSGPWKHDEFLISNFSFI